MLIFLFWTTDPNGSTFKRLKVLLVVVSQSVLLSKLLPHCSGVSCGCIMYQLVWFRQSLSFSSVLKVFSGVQNWIHVQKVSPGFLKELLWAYVSKLPLFAICLLLLSSLSSPVSVLRPESWDFSYSVLPCTCPDCTELNERSRVGGGRETVKTTGVFGEKPLSLGDKVLSSSEFRFLFLSGTAAGLLGGWGARKWSRNPRRSSALSEHENPFCKKVSKSSLFVLFQVQPYSSSSRNQG